MHVHAAAAIPSSFCKPLPSLLLNSHLRAAAQRSKHMPALDEVYLGPQEEEEGIGDVDLFQLDGDGSRLGVQEKWLGHLAERQLGEDGHPRKVPPRLAPPPPPPRRGYPWPGAWRRPLCKCRKDSSKGSC